MVRHASSTQRFVWEGVSRTCGPKSGDGQRVCQAGADRATLIRPFDLSQAKAEFRLSNQRRTETRGSGNYPINGRTETFSRLGLFKVRLARLAQRMVLRCYLLRTTCSSRAGPDSHWPGM
jgi:hypothetical protein